MFTVFVLGNIASGKSTACRYLESRGAMLIDLDELAKSLYVPGSDIVNALAEEFGWDILDGESFLTAGRLNSNAMNIETTGYLPPLWQVVWQYAQIGLIVLLAVWGVFAFVTARKKDKKAK